MKRPSIFWLVLLALWMSPVSAKDMADLYDDATLAYWQRIIPPDIQWNFDHVVWPVLTAEEKKRLAGVRLAFPLRGVNNDPLDFYATYPPPTVTLPLLSLRFFGDVSLAVAWLWANGYDLQTAYNHLAMLKYKEAEQFPGGRYPQPLEAIGVPDDVRDDPKVYDVFQKTYKSAVVFILAHELGHIYHRHPGYGPQVTAEQAKMNEEQADRFALEIMRRIGEAPNGMTVFFMMLAHWEPNRWDFPSEAHYRRFLAEEATHPLTARRLRVLAERMEEVAPDFARNEPDYDIALQNVRFIAEQVKTIAGFLEDEEVQQGIRLIGQSTDPASLAPHRQLPLQPGQDRDRAGHTASAFDGTFEGEMTDPTGSLPVRLMLQQRGDQVSGIYSFGLGVGTINGFVEGNSLYYDWQWGESYGRGVLRAEASGTDYSGTWGLGESRDDGGTWWVRRQ